MTARVAVTFESGIASVRLNRADKRNALDLEMFQSIAAAQREVRRHDGVRAVILQGDGEDFCTGRLGRGSVGAVCFTAVPASLPSPLPRTLVLALPLRIPTTHMVLPYEATCQSTARVRNTL